MLLSRAKHKVANQLEIIKIVVGEGGNHTDWWIFEPVIQ